MHWCGLELDSVLNRKTTGKSLDFIHSVYDPFHSVGIRTATTPARFDGLWNLAKSRLSSEAHRLEIQHMGYNVGRNNDVPEQRDPLETVTRKTATYLHREQHFCPFP